jgi:hypothetical protein
MWAFCPTVGRSSGSEPQAAEQRHLDRLMISRLGVAGTCCTAFRHETPDISGRKVKITILQNSYLGMSRFCPGKTSWVK